MARRPDGPPPPPTVQRLRVRYTKRGRLRFVSHRDFARSFERALRRAEVPMAYSAGFTPHPKISYVGAAPTGVSSEAEYLEIGLAERRDVDQLRRQLDESLPDGLDLVEMVECGPGSLADRMQASVWEIRLGGVEAEVLAAAVEMFLATEQVTVSRLMKNGPRDIDVRGPVVSATVEASTADGQASTADGQASTADGEDDPPGPTTVAGGAPCATLHLVVRHMTPAVRPDDVLSGLRLVADLSTPTPPVATRRAQGPLSEAGTVTDPLAPDHEAAAEAASQAVRGLVPASETAAGPQAG